MKIQSEKCYAGVDVSKSFLDVYILPYKKYMQFKNDAKGIKKMTQKMLSFPDVSIALEATGGYERSAVQSLQKEELSVAVVNPRVIRDFAKALGKLAKTDQVDAQVIALFAEKIQPVSTRANSEAQQKLAKLSARRRQLVEMISMEKNRLDKVSGELKESIKRVIRILEKELAAIEKLMEELIQSDAEYMEKNALLKTIKGVGTVVAGALVADLPELGSLGPKQISALVGLAPYNRDSGALKGKRTIWGGRAGIRATLYMSALVASRYNPKIREFYQRLCLAGKPKKVAITACMHKLLIIMNAMIRKAEPWQHVATA